MTNFVVKDSLQDSRAIFTSLRANTLERGRGNIKPARLQHHRHDRQSRSDVMSGILRRAPQAVMDRQRSVSAIQRFELACDQREMHRLIGGDTQKIIDELPLHCGTEATGHVEREVDGSELDMRQRMPQRDPVTLRTHLAALGHLRGWQQLERSGPSGTIGHGDVEFACQAAQTPVTRHLTRSEDLRCRFAGEERLANCLRDGTTR